MLLPTRTQLDYYHRPFFDDRFSTNYPLTTCKILQIDKAAGTEHNRSHIFSFGEPSESDNILHRQPVIGWKIAKEKS